MKYNNKASALLLIIIIVIIVIILVIGGYLIFKSLKKVDWEKSDNTPQKDFQCKNSKYSTVRNSYQNNLITLTEISEEKLYLSIEEKGFLALNDISDLDCLEFLELGNSIPINDLTPLSLFNNLKELDFWTGKEFTSLSPLSNLNNLEVLNIRMRLDQRADISPLSNLIKLRVLGVSTKDISPLNKLTNLEDLALTHSEISDLTPLLNLNKLKRLNLYSSKIDDISILYQMKNLEILNVNLDSSTSISNDECTNLRSSLPNTNVMCNWKDMNVIPEN
jgi:internalin A